MSLKGWCTNKIKIDHLMVTRCWCLTTLQASTRLPVHFIFLLVSIRPANLKHNVYKA